MSHTAVIDIGKTNAKLALVEAATLAEVAVITRPNTVLPGPPWPHFDVEGHWTFLLDGLARFHADHGVDEISITTHGACAALIGHDGKLAAPILDYEHKGPDTLADDYDAIRPAFAKTGSPRLGMGLNIGAQLYWQLRSDPTLKARTRHIVTYPQYWGFRLTGVAATDVTSLGCHTDLWNPHKGTPSPLVERLEISELLAPVHRPADVLGPILPEIAARTGLAPDTPVRTGIHDSNASLLPHLQDRDAPFNVVSTGTWVIVMAIGGVAVTLDPARDTLINTNAFGAPVPSARFMGGREYDILNAGQPAIPTQDEINAAIAAGDMLLPAVQADSGPFIGCQAQWVGKEPDIGTPARSAAIGFYLALETAYCLALVGGRGPILVEGPFARNESFLQMLAAATGADVHAMTSQTGTSEGAARLVDRPGAQRDLAPLLPAAKPPPGADAYAQAWRAAVDQMTGVSARDA